MASPSDGIAVTGATGYLGVHTSRRLVAAGKTVTALVRPTSNVARLLTYAPSVLVRCYRTADEFRSLMMETGRQGIVHLASPHVSTDPDTLCAEIASLAETISEVMSEQPSTPVVAIGTWWEWNDDGHIAPVNPYATAKLRQRERLAAAAKMFGGRCLSLIPHDIYGPADWRPKVMTAMINAARTGRHLPASLGHQQLDWVHVADMADAIVLALELTAALLPGHAAIYRISAGECLNLRELAALIVSLGGQLDVRWGALAQRPGQRQMPHIPVPLLPGWTPQRRLAAFLEAELSLSTRQPDEWN